MKIKNLLLTAGLVLAAFSANAGESSSAVKTPPVAPRLELVAGFSGKVLETMNADVYTYILVDAGARKLWAAAPKFNVKTGETVVVSPGMMMTNYYSKILNRDFDSVCFSGSATVQDASAKAGHPGGHPEPAKEMAAGLPKGHLSVPAAAASPKVDVTGIKPAAGGKTIQEIIAGKAALDGKSVVVRGKVVKYNSGIMGKNWLHIQDGTGSAGSNDLTVTTATEAKVGDTVLVTGKISSNKDFGSGYKYALILEDARVVVE